ncbi:hydroxymethylglutaryl-CoA lyase [Roseomonas sp. M0104]|uniref:Hydroxymethylglutaryl-CoA lyase n=1 Tax=Teichococcus coralli TaxID=2545983 RepID=A0A845B9A5_9PROT|nr:hydroxymethylglutaryl-CoA lyase [Pseudoroseomonas coralli]MXP63761.1 hydroxymethylglutaryl-CoA lyase [Pseudoroseomonas coralli]
MPDVTIVEVGPRDGFQPIARFIPTEEKLAIIQGCAAAGLHRIEAGAFVGTAAVPQMADAEAVLAATLALPGADPQMLVPNARHARRALAAGARHLVWVVSVSEAHNRSNIRMSPADSVAEFAALLPELEGVRLRVNIATAFDCPFTGRVAPEAALDLVGRLAALRPDAEYALCDTTGRADPAHVAGLHAACAEAFPRVAAWAFHGHDTYGLGLANIMAAHGAGVRVFDAAIAGLGGCPFAPGATGNVATEDVAWMFARMGASTGVDLGALLPVARRAAALPGGCPGGRVRQAMAARPAHLAA